MIKQLLDMRKLVNESTRIERIEKGIESERNVENSMENNRDSNGKK